MIVYFIGGSKDLSKQVLEFSSPPRELVYWAPWNFGQSIVLREHYMYLGDVPSHPDACVYSFVRSEKVKLEGGENVS